MSDDPNRTVRLLWRNSPRGVYRIALETTAARLEDCADWAHEAAQFDPDVQFRFEETTGEVIRQTWGQTTPVPPAVVVPDPVAPLPPAPVQPPPVDKPPSAIAGLWALLRGRF